MAQAAPTPHTDSELARQTLTAAVLRAATLLKVSQTELSQILGVSSASISRMTNQRYWLDPHGKEWQLAALFVRLFRSLDSLTGGREDLSRAWLRSHNRDLDSVPATLLGEVSGLVLVVQYLDQSRAPV